jgi:hypothetical protein
LRRSIRNSLLGRSGGRGLFFFFFVAFDDGVITVLFTFLFHLLDLHLVSVERERKKKTKVKTRAEKKRRRKERRGDELNHLRRSDFVFAS